MHHESRLFSKNRLPSRVCLSLTQSRIAHRTPACIPAHPSLPATPPALDRLNVSALFLPSENLLQNHQQNQNANYKSSPNQQILNRVLTENDSVHHSSQILWRSFASNRRVDGVNITLLEANGYWLLDAGQKSSPGIRGNLINPFCGLFLPIE